MLDILKDLPDWSGIFDTHSHYDDERFAELREPLLQELFEGGLAGIITCGCDISSSKSAIELAEKHEGIYAAVGFHPENLPESPEELQKLLPLLSHKKVVALGEIGLDYYWDIPKAPQLELFEQQLAIANEQNLPVIVHDREAHGDTLEILKKHKPRGVLHCFSGSVETAKEILNLGMYIGIGGVVTFKNARKTVELAEMLPADRILLETDCPYLAPVPMRGKLCHSGLIRFTAEKIAEIRGTSAEDIISQTRQNAKILFGI